MKETKVSGKIYNDHGSEVTRGKTSASVRHSTTIQQHSCTFEKSRREKKHAILSEESTYAYHTKPGREWE